MSINDLQNVADTIIDLQVEITPILEQIEDLKDVLRDATTKADKALRFSSAKGMVETKRGSVAELKGEEPVLNSTVFATLPEETKTMLVDIGVVSLKEVWSKNSKPAITVKPVTQKQAAA